MSNYNSLIRKKLKKPGIWAAILLATAFVWVLIFYWASQTPKEYCFRIWIGADKIVLTEDTEAKVRDACGQNGMRECKINTYNPSDYYYAAAFGMQSNSIDVYVLKVSEANDIAQAGIFGDISALGGGSFLNETLEYENTAIGLKIGEDYCVLYNANSKKSPKLLYSVVSAIAMNGEIE